MGLNDLIQKISKLYIAYNMYTNLEKYNYGYHYTILGCKSSMSTFSPPILLKLSRTFPMEVAGCWCRNGGHLTELAWEECDNIHASCLEWNSGME